MTVRRCFSAIVIVALVAGLVPASASAAQPAQTAGHAQPDLRNAIHRAAARAAGDRAPEGSVRGEFAAREARTQSNGGGGGGHTMMVVSLLTTVAGLAGTYFVVKQLQKKTDQIK